MTYYHLAIHHLKNSEAKDEVFKTYISVSLFFGYNRKTKQGLYNIDSALHYAHLALTETERIQFPLGMAFCQNVYGIALSLEDSILKANGQKLLKLAQDAKTFFEADTSNLQYTSALINEASAKWALGQITEAKKIATNLRQELITRDILYLRYRIAVTENNYKNALSYYQKLKKIDETETFEAQKARIAELQAQYETKQQADKIRELAHQTDFQDLEISRKNQWLVMAGISILAFLAFFSAMYYRVQQRTTRQKMEKIDLEQRFLLSQLNPHFIFNALDAIQNYILTHDSKQANNYLVKFAKLMRQVLQNSREDFILLDDEIQMLERYMELHKLQANKDFDFQITLADDLETDMTLIPPMFVQPFVENAIKHGLIQENGQILICFFIESHYIGIHFIDNGIGLQKSQKITNSQKHQSFATTIISERIRNYNQRLNTNITLHLSELKSKTEQTKGTEVLLKVPFQEA